MCGILGWVGQGRPPFSDEAFSRALSTLAHRGPDDSVMWSESGVMLGFRRLAIIDLSSAGRQPMKSASGDSMIVFNGEVYNYIELKEELRALNAPMQGGADTSVLLSALETWGPAAIPRLNGMWAFALWNRSKKELLLSRDRFGVKPLYYRRGSDGIAFASEPKALLELYPQCRRINSKTLLRFLAYNELFTSDNSFYDGISILPLAHCAVFKPVDGSFSLRRYWSYPEQQGNAFALGEIEEEFSALFEDSVRLRLRADVPVGITLSGGLDSSAILAAASSNHRDPPVCFTSTYGPAGGSEIGWAKLAADSKAATLVEVPAAQDDWLEILSDVAWHMDAPGYSPAVYPLWCLMRVARARSVPVVLEGQGADEALGGYSQYAVLEFLDYISGRAGNRSLSGVSQRVAGMRGAFSLFWATAWMARELSPKLLKWHRSRVGFQSLMRSNIELPEPTGLDQAGRRDRMQHRLLTDHSRDILPGLLHYGDAISMAHSIESRTPFLDYRLVEWMFRLPTKLKIKDGATKWVLRRFLEAHSMKAIAQRKDKRGYPTPVSQWLASEQGQGIASRLTSAESPLQEWIDPQRLLKLFDLHRSGAIAADHHIYKLLSAQMWINRCIAP